MKIIDFNSVKNICNNISADNFYDWIDYILKNKNDFVMPTKTRINQNNGNYFAIMPALYEKDNLAMVKMIGRHELRENEKRSSMMSDLLLYQADTGILKSLIDGEYITTLRTGAAAAHAAIMYGKSDFSTIGMIGLGNIMTACGMVLFSKLANKKLTVRLYKHHSQEVRFVKQFKKYTNINFEFCDTYEETIRGTDVILSAVTRATDNFCSDDCYSEGCTVIPIMTLGFQNCDLFFDKVFTDEINQIKGFKYFNKFKYVKNTTDVMLGNAKGRENDRERILVYYYGLAIHDLYFASQIYSQAKDVDNYNYNYCTKKYFM